MSPTQQQYRPPADLMELDRELRVGLTRSHLRVLTGLQQHGQSVIVKAASRGGKTVVVGGEQARWEQRMAKVRQRPDGVDLFAEHAATRRLMDSSAQMIDELGAHPSTREALLFMAVCQRSMPIATAATYVRFSEDLRMCVPQVRALKETVSHNWMTMQVGGQPARRSPGIARRIDYLQLRYRLVRLAEIAAKELNPGMASATTHRGEAVSRVGKYLTCDGQQIPGPVAQRPAYGETQAGRDADEARLCGTLLDVGFSAAKDPPVRGWNDVTIWDSLTGLPLYSELRNARGTKEGSDREIDVAQRGVAYLGATAMKTLRPEFYIADMGSEAKEFQRWLVRNAGVMPVIPVDKLTRTRWARENHSDVKHGVRLLCPHCKVPADTVYAEGFPGHDFREKYGLEFGQDAEEVWLADSKAPRPRVRHECSRCGKWSKSVYWADDVMVNQRLVFPARQDDEGIRRQVLTAHARNRAESGNNQGECWGLGQEDGNRNMWGVHKACQDLLHQLIKIAISARAVAHMTGVYDAEKERLAFERSRRAAG